MISKKLTNGIVMLALISLFMHFGCGNNSGTAAEQAAQTSESGHQAQQQSSGDFVVKVNGEPLTEKELQSMVDGKLNALEKQLSPEQKKQLTQQREQITKQLKEKFTQGFITKTILNQEAKKQGITVSDKDIDAELDKYRQQLPENMKLETVLQMQGMSLESMRDEIRYNLRVQKLIDKKVQVDEQPSQKEIASYYETNKQKFDEPESVHARHILIKAGDEDNETAKAEKREKIEALRKKIVGGADFAEIAQQHSECPSSKKGGDLGTFSRGRMVPAFEKAAFDQEINEISPVVETQFGYHLIQTLEHNEAQTKTLKDVKADIADTLVREKKNEAIREYIANLKDKAEIVYAKN